MCSATHLFTKKLNKVEFLRPSPTKKAACSTGTTQVNVVCVLLGLPTSAPNLFYGQAFPPKHSSAPVSVTLSACRTRWALPAPTIPTSFILWANPTCCLQRQSLKQDSRRASR